MPKLSKLAWILFKPPPENPFWKIGSVVGIAPEIKEQFAKACAGYRAARFRKGRT